MVSGRAFQPRACSKDAHRKEHSSLLQMKVA